MPVLPMPPSAPFLDREQFHMLIDRGIEFYIDAVSERTGADPKGLPKQELVYLISVPALVDGPAAFSLDATPYRRTQADLITAARADGHVGPCLLVKKDGKKPGEFYYSLQPA